MKILTALGLIFGLVLASGCAPQTQAEKDATEIEKISEIAAKTCGSKDKVETVNLKGFTCKE